MRFTVKPYTNVQTNTGEEDSGTEAEKVESQETISPKDKSKSSQESVVDEESDSNYSTIGEIADQSMSSVARRGRIYAKRHKRRLVYKDGECNVSHANISSRKRKYLVDLFTTLMDMRWRYNLLLFAMAFVCSWLFFAFLWWVILIIHGDHNHVDDENWTPCAVAVYDFTTALLFSIETQHTIGYGSRSMETKCPEAIFLLMLQSCFGVFIQSLMTGLIFAKLSRPKRRGQTIMFSKSAVICQRDDEMCLLFRIADMRKSHIVSTTLRAMLVKNKITKEGEFLPLCQLPLFVKTENCDDYVYLLWPVTVIHTIDDTSPLWGMSAEDLLKERFEIIVLLEGTVESTGMTTQVRTSYLPSEILWGHRLASLMTYQKENGHYEIDYTQFHQTVPVQNMPDCSAKCLSQVEKTQRRCSHQNPHTHTDDCCSYQHTTNSLPPVQFKKHNKDKDTPEKEKSTFKTRERPMQRSHTVTASQSSGHSKRNGDCVRRRDGALVFPLSHNKRHRLNDFMKYISRNGTTPQSQTGFKESQI